MYIMRSLRVLGNSHIVRLDCSQTCRAGEGLAKDELRGGGVP